MPANPRPRPSLRIAAPLLLVALCGAMGCGAKSNRPGSGQTSGAETAPRKVRLARAEQGTLPRVITVSGTLAAQERTELAFKVAGRIETVAVDLGSRVAAGQILARLAPSDFELRVASAESALAQARARLGLPPAEAGDDSGPLPVVDPATTSPVRQASAQLEQARVTRDRVRSLYDQKLVPRADLDRAEADFGVAEARYQDSLEEARSRQALLAQRRAELDLARQQLADSTLRAPFAGAIEERRIAPGDYVTAGTPAVVLVRTHPLRLQLAVPERDAVGLAIGQPVRVRLDDGREASGRVARLSPAIAESNRTLRIEAEIPNPAGALRPGAFVRAEIVTRPAEPSVLVPSAALVSFAGVDKVLSVAEGKAVERRVRVGRKSGERVEIVDGVAAGDPVVLDPGNLTEGQPVEVER